MQYDIVCARERSYEKLHRAEQKLWAKVVREVHPRGQSRVRVKVREGTVMVKCDVVQKDENIFFEHYTVCGVV